MDDEPFAALNEPLNILFYLNPKIEHPERLYEEKIMKIRAMKISQLGTFNLGSFVSFTVSAVNESHSLRHHAVDTKKYYCTKAMGQVVTYLQVHV